MTTYYIKDSIVYSSSATTLTIPYEFESFIEEELTPENIIEILDKYYTNGYREYTIYGVISDFESVKEKIASATKNKPSEEDYSFVEITSQLLVIKQLKEMITTVISQFPPENVIKILDEKEQKINEYRKELEKKLKKTKQQYEKKKKKYDSQLNEEVEKRYNDNEELKKEIDTKKKEKNKLEEQLSSLTNSQNISKEVSKLNSEIENISFKKQSLEYDIDVLEAKIKTLKNEKKAGYTKKVSPLYFILTLGLIYWTKYATLTHQISSIHIAIFKKQETISQLKKKLFIKEHKKNSLLEQQQLSAKEQTQKQEELAHSIESIQETISQLQEKFEKNQKAIEKAQKELNPLKEDLEEEESAISTLEKNLEEIQDSIKEKGFEIIKKTQQYHNELLEEITSIEEQIQSQKVSYKEDLICEL